MPYWSKKHTVQDGWLERSYIQLQGIEYLKDKFALKQVRVLERYIFYDMKYTVEDLEISASPRLRDKQSTLGWCQKAVDFTDTQLYSKRLGEILGNTFKEVLKEDVLPDGRLYWNIAERIIS